MCMEGKLVSINQHHEIVKQLCNKGYTYFQVSNIIKPNLKMGDQFTLHRELEWDSTPVY